MKTSQNNAPYWAINPNAVPGFLPALDGLRAFSILIVIAAHLGFGSIIPGGFGVTVFFFVSGFLITRLLASELNRNGRIAISSFYMRRFLRLYPVLLALIVIVALLSAAIGVEILPSHLLSASFYFVNYYDTLGEIFDWPERIAAWGHLWSLAVEEHFYILFPLLLVVFGRNHNHRIFIVIVAIILSFAARIFAYIYLPQLADYTYMASECRFESIAWGALLALMLDGYGKNKGNRIQKINSLIWTIAAFLILLASFVIRDESFRAIWRYSLQGLAIFILVFNLYFNRQFAFAIKILDLRLMRFIGRLSYSLYLWHWPIIWYFARLQGIDAGEAMLSPLYMALALGFSFIFAAVSYYCIEKPFFSLRKKYGARIVEEMKA